MENLFDLDIQQFYLAIAAAKGATSLASNDRLSWELSHIIDHNTHTPNQFEELKNRLAEKLEI